MGRGLGTVQWGEAERQQVLEYLLEGFGWPASTSPHCNGWLNEKPGTKWWEK